MVDLSAGVDLSHILQRPSQEPQEGLSEMPDGAKRPNGQLVIMPAACAQKPSGQFTTLHADDNQYILLSTESIELIALRVQELLQPKKGR